MKVLLVGNYVPDGQASMQAFSRVLERELPDHGCEMRVAAAAARAVGGAAFSSVEEARVYRQVRSFHP